MFSGFLQRNNDPETEGSGGTIACNFLLILKKKPAAPTRLEED